MNLAEISDVIKASPAIHQLNGLETQSFRFGRKNRPLGKDQSVKKTLDFQSKLLYN